MVGRRLENNDRKERQRQKQGDGAERGMRQRLRHKKSRDGKGRHSQVEG